MCSSALSFSFLDHSKLVDPDADEAIRITRYLGCITAFLVFVWRYVNIPENWAYVASWWSIGGMIVTLAPETIYPFVYIWAYGKEKEKAKIA